LDAATILLASTGTHPIIQFATSWPWKGVNIGLQVLNPISLTRNTEVDQSKFALSTLVFELQDVGSVSPIIREGIKGYICKLSASFWDIAWAGNNVSQFLGVVTSVEQQGSVYVVTAQSSMTAAQEKNIFSAGSTVLVDAIDATATLLHVADASTFSDAQVNPE